MPFGIAAAILAGGGLASAGIGAFGSISAADTAASAANNAAQLQLQEFNKTQGNLLPFVQGGTSALGALMNELALSQNGTVNVNAGGSILQNPLNILGPPPVYKMPQYTAQRYQQSPGYAAALAGGTQALQNAGATTTGGLSGNVLKALQSTGTAAANLDYQTNYQNFATNYLNQFTNNNANFWNQYNALNQGNTNIFNWLNALAGTGASAGGALGQIGTTAAGNAGNALIGAGAAQAAGTLGATNAAAGGINSLLTLGASPSTGLANSYLAAILNGGGQAQDFGGPGATFGLPQA
jgi:hypothetical protein